MLAYLRSLAFVANAGKVTYRYLTLTIMKDISATSLRHGPSTFEEMEQRPSDVVNVIACKNREPANVRIVVAPGLHNSGRGHWQTRWETMHPSFERIEQRHWDMPDLAAWSAQVGHTLRRSARPAIVVAHSFGCLATVHRAAAGATNLAGALLVAPADPYKFGISVDLAIKPLVIPTIVIGSENDPWLSLTGAQRWARQWGSAFVNAGPLGHINTDSMLGDWPFGLALLEQLVERVQARPAARCGLPSDAAQLSQTRSQSYWPN